MKSENMNLFGTIKQGIILRNCRSRFLPQHAWISELRIDLFDKPVSSLCRFGVSMGGDQRK